ncbi:MAG: geranylgeranylglyceryl/heptaprenylglyceryl phosphate synthase, partial [Tenuifilaceae bacterium]|nr:geranylgeranylglyceryl/heptaprenylglyceryl phosphate synthase [Tenuifilaceae bacterium]
VFQFTPTADAILLLSLISGRNPEYLIGNHVIASQAIKESRMEVIPTGYMLIDSGQTSSAQYMSNTSPIPRSKPDIALATALAGEQLGLKTIYLEGGSGAQDTIPEAVIKTVCNNVSIPVIVGGGIKTPKQVKAIRLAGASMVVVGNSIEKNPHQLEELVAASR